jgi:hypothetical protein
LKTWIHGQLGAPTPNEGGHIADYSGAEHRICRLGAGGHKCKSHNLCGAAGAWAAGTSVLTSPCGGLVVNMSASPQPWGPYAKVGYVLPGNAAGRP